MRFLFHLLKRDAITRKFALRAREIRLAAASQAGGRSAANLRTGLAFASVRHGWLLQNKSTPVGRLHLGLSENQVIERLLQTVTNKYRPNLRL